jgi:hypothetical protein
MIGDESKDRLFLKLLAMMEEFDPSSEIAPRARKLQDETRRALMEAWAASQGVEKCQGPMFWRRLLGERLDYCKRLPGDDHTSLWQRNGRPELYVSQPYPERFTDRLPEMMAAAAEHGLAFTVNTRPAWHYPGRCLFVTWRRASPVRS